MEVAGGVGREKSTLPGGRQVLPTSTSGLCLLHRLVPTLQWERGPSSPPRPWEPQFTCLLPHPHHSLQGSGPDPEMVPALHGTPGDEAAVHLEHLPVHGVCRAARPGQGAVGRGTPPALPPAPGQQGPGAQRCSQSGPSWVSCHSPLKPSLLGFFCSSMISSAILWTISLPAVTTRVSMSCHTTRPPVSGC